MKKAIVLLSGGLDSSTALYVAKKEGFDELYALTFEYGQKHDREIRSASQLPKPSELENIRLSGLC
nr:7-cyano-7-deazaguanine synthase [Odoribacter sp. OF09-27XD]